MTTPRYWAVVPAAGSGRRMQSIVPKQYLSLAGRPVLEHTLVRLARQPELAGIVVALSADDEYWATLAIKSDIPLYTAGGGSERHLSVLYALRDLASFAAPDDWVLVHDAARPCVRNEDISRLIHSVRDDPVGGLLAVPVTETVKRATEDQRVIETVDRRHLWRAQTPQMFRLQSLLQALEQVVSDRQLVTDEAGAMEYCGMAPRIVPGHADNIKITEPQDLGLAEHFLRQQVDQS
ncbi:MAG: 2-C-methyl-D-erythritol 4-phosphate cytidylyltransferase [Gammaproteobacteria bacterium]|nr:2-C-methyl-D-erythritol 4-phosphate cytidylyltransferase [Gammaproteobacteria bacterium]